MILFMGVKLHAYPRAIIVNKLVDFLYGDKTRLIATPNPEMLLLAQKRPSLKEVLGSVDMGVCDGSGLVRILKMKGLYGVERITGVDLVDDLARVCAQHDRSIMFVGAGPGIAARARDVLMKKYSGLRAEAYVGPNVSYKINKAHPYAENDEEVLVEIDRFKPDVLVLALGAGAQEEWLAKYKDRLAYAKILIGVGGALDMISGAIPRAPMFIQKIGLEWMWRLFVQPSRIIRILRAVLVFPLVAWRHKMYFGDGVLY